MTNQGLESGVLLVDIAYGFGGVETRVVDTARGLRELGIDVEVACLAGSPVVAALTRAAVPTRCLAGVKWDPRLILSLRRLLAARPGWVVDAHNAQSQMAVHVAATGLPGHFHHVATIHSEYRASERPLIGLSWHEAVLKRTIRAGWELVPVSTSVRRNLLSLGAAPERIRLIWSGISDEQPRRSRAAIREELGIAAHQFVVAAVGRLVPVKNVALAIDAVVSMRGALPTACLLVIGDGPERAHLERLATEADATDLVRFMGHRDDAGDLLGASDALVITSTTEGLPYVLLEAAAAQVPVVTTPVGAIPEVFGDGAVVLLPPSLERRPDGVALLAAELLSLAQDRDRRDQLVARASAIQKHHLSLESMLASTLRAYSLPVDSGRRT